VSLADETWYAGPEIPLPVSGTAATSRPGVSHDSGPTLLLVR